MPEGGGFTVVNIFHLVDGKRKLYQNTGRNPKKIINKRDYGHKSLGCFPTMENVERHKFDMEHHLQNGAWAWFAHQWSCETKTWCVCVWDSSMLLALRLHALQLATDNYTQTMYEHATWHFDFWLCACVSETRLFKVQAGWEMQTYLQSVAGHETQNHTKSSIKLCKKMMSKAARCQGPKLQWRLIFFILF